MWRSEGGEQVSRSVDDDSCSVEPDKSQSDAFPFPESVKAPKNLSSPRSSFHNQQPPSQKRINSSSSSTTDSQRLTSSIHRESLRLRNIGPPRHCESSELADSPVRTEAIKVSLVLPSETFPFVFN